MQRYLKDVLRWAVFGLRGAQLFNNLIIIEKSVMPSVQKP